MTRELAAKMKSNLCNPMKTFQEIYGSDFWKGLARGIWGHKEMR
jgi:hypothetical protein